MEKQEIWILGQTGQLATCLKQEASHFPFLNLSFFNRNQVNFENDLIPQLNALPGLPAFIINTVAYTAVDLAEQEKSKAERINALALEELMTWASDKKIPVIHFSTDYVFNGQAQSPYTEENITDPINTYGKTKLLGEQVVLKHKTGTVFRISWLYSSEGKNFLLTIKNKLHNNQPLSVVNDQFGCATSAHALAFDILSIIQNNRLTEQTFGLYHYSHDGIISWFEFAEEIKKQISSTVSITAVETKDFQTAAKRPVYSKLDPAKSLSTFGLPHRNWKTELKNELNR